MSSDRDVEVQIGEGIPARLPDGDEVILDAGPVYVYGRDIIRGETEDLRDFPDADAGVKGNQP